MSDSFGQLSISHPDVSIVVVNYNSGDMLRRCVEINLSQATELIVVDNRSTDGSLEPVVNEFSGNEKLRIIQNLDNLGFAAGCNKGAYASKGEFILFLNPDCMADPDAVQQLAKALQADECAGMAGGLLLDPNGEEQLGGRRTIPTPWRTFVRVFHLYAFEHRWPMLFKNFNLYKEPLPIAPISMEAISGACTMVKRDAMKDVGPWDEAYFLHCEDLDLCMRYRQKKWKILFVPTARFIHYRGACSRSRPIFVEWNKHFGMMRFYRKFFLHQYPGPLFVLVGIGVWLRFLAVLISIGLKKAIGKNQHNV